MYAYLINNKEVSPVMKIIYELVKDKNCFVVTTNTDSHFTLAGFAKERLFEIEGNSRYLRCSHGCHNQIYQSDELLNEMDQNQENGKDPANRIPMSLEYGDHGQVHVEGDGDVLN